MLCRGLLDVGEAHLLHRVQVVEVAPILLEPVCSRQRGGVVAQMVLSELARGIAEIAQEDGQCRSAWLQEGRAPGSCGGIMPVRSGYMPVKNALRPEVQLCMAR